jgi:hypothetical protein
LQPVWLPFSAGFLAAAALSGWLGGCFFGCWLGGCFRRWFGGCFRRYFLGCWLGGGFFAAGLALL